MSAVFFVHLSHILKLTISKCCVQGKVMNMHPYIYLSYLFSRLWWGVVYEVCHTILFYNLSLFCYFIQGHMFLRIQNYL